MADGSKPLANERHEIFAQAVACRGASDAEAYAAAGYAGGRNATRNAYRLQQRPTIAARIAHLKRRAAGKAEVTLARWLEEVAGIAFADIRDVLDFGPDGVRLKAGADLRPEHAALIAEVAETKDGGQRVKLHSKMDALDKLARALSYYEPERIQHSGPDGGPIVHEVTLPAEVQEILDRIRSRADSR